MESTKRAILYARVSTRDQHVETQLLPLRQYVQSKGWAVVAEFADVGESGAKQNRPQLNLLMQAVRARKCDAVVCWRFDRFARSVRHLITALEEFKSLGVDFSSVSEQIDTSTAAGRMVFSMVGAIAEFERSIIIERVRAGLDRARLQGKRLGRPKFIPQEDPHQLKASGMSVQHIAEKLGVGKSWVYEALSAKPRENAYCGSIPQDK